MWPSETQVYFGPYNLVFFAVFFLDCFIKQGNWRYALFDYQQTEEMLPGDAATWLRLAVVHNTLGSFCFQDGSGPTCRFWSPTLIFTRRESRKSFCVSTGVSRRRWACFLRPWSSTPQFGQVYENRMKTFRKGSERTWSVCRSWTLTMRRGVYVCLERQTKCRSTLLQHIVWSLC